MQHYEHYISNLNYFQMGKKTLEQVLKENQELGFDKAVIEIAYANVGGDSERIIQQIFRLQQDSQNFPTKPSNPQDEDAQLSKAIELSMNEAKDKKINLEPLNPEQRIRKSGVPVGLKNIGNTCYFNSLLQTYFQNIPFVRNILSYQTPKKYRGVKDEEIQKLSQEDFQFKRKLSSCRLVEQLKQLFCNLIASDRKYIDPTSVLSSIVDDYGNELTIGDQKDIGQFNLVFLSRIEDGLEESRKDKQMDIEHEKKESHIDSPSKINFLGKQQSLQSSMLSRRSSIRINEKSIIGEQFIGKIENCFINEKQNINKSQEELFSLLFVNVKNKDLYKACEEITVSHIDDYRNEKGEVIGVEKHSWIKEAPKTLFFQIDRVVYDKTTLTPHKINDSFDFPTTFYIDPFLHKNRETALKLQNSVRSLRQKKEHYLNALQSIQKYGSKKLNLLDLLGETFNFLQSQGNKMQTENELDNPTLILNLKDKIDGKLLHVLKAYQESFEERVKGYKQKIVQIDRQIEKAYRQINKTPYNLYSLLIHEGGADSGHYYSYTYDFQSKKWRKYNDINISQQVQEQVLKQGKGINAASAYYLVYAQEDVLVPKDAHKLLYKMSAEEGYMKDYYSSFLSTEQRNYINAQNNQMYYDIEQYKMNSFATRVVDVYAKKFQTFNQIFRKTKIEKKKNTPPTLTSLPVYVKSIDQDQYKCLIIEQSINQYGPKEHNIVFEQLVKKKLGNFNDFKKPKKFYCNGKHTEAFIKGYYLSIAARKLFESIEKEDYSCIFGLLREMLSTDSQDYFNWLGRLLTKIFVVRLLVQAERDVKSNIKSTLQRLEMIAVILLKYIIREQEKMLHINVIFWINEIMIEAGEGKEKIEEILSIVDNYKYENQYEYLEKRGENQFKEIVSSVDLNDALWNSSRQENTVVNAMLDYREKVKGKMESCNKLYIEMKKFTYPLKKEERDKIVKI